MKHYCLLLSLWTMLLAGSLQPAFAQQAAQPETTAEPGIIKKVLQPAPLSGQAPVYTLSLKKDLPLLAAAGTSFVAGHWLMGEVPTLTEEDIAGLDPQNINSFDRAAIRYYRPGHGKISDYLFALSAAAPFAVFASPVARNEFGPLMVMYAETAVLTRGLTAVSKGLFMRNRPYTYHADAPLADKMSVDARHSFFSGHMASTTAFCFLTAAMVHEYARRPGWKWAAWTGAVVIPGAMGYWRYTSGNHFPSDLIVAYLVGGGTGILVPYLHKNKLSGDMSFNIQALPNGVYMALTF